jgi:hypothetical protein
MSSELVKLPLTTTDFPIRATRRSSDDRLAIVGSAVTGCCRPSCLEVACWLHMSDSTLRDQVVVSVWRAPDVTVRSIRVPGNPHGGFGGPCVRWSAAASQKPPVRGPAASGGIAHKSRPPGLFVSGRSTGRRLT